MNARKLITFAIVCFAASCQSFPIYAQKHFFQHYDIENGLIQSQVTSITQDRDNQLWISTLGGINCYDSRQFTPFTVEDGLPDNACLSIASDQNGQIWSGNSSGLTRFDQGGIRNYPFAGNMKTRGVRQIMNDGAGEKWALVGYKLFRLTDGRLVRQKLTSDSDMVTAIQVNAKGEMFAAVHTKGIYKLQASQWRLVFHFGETGDPTDSFINYFIFYHGAQDKIFFISSRQLFSYSGGGVLSEIGPAVFEKNHSALTCLLSDNNGGMWIGSSNGAYLAKSNELTFFNENNGFASARIFCIFKDGGGNVWFGTDGAGLYQYPQGSPLIFDNTQGLSNSVVTGLANGANGEVFISTNGTGIFSYKNKKLSEIKLGNAFENKKVNCLYTDPGDTLWVGADNAELWKINGKTIVRVFPKKGEKGERTFTSIFKDSHNMLWVTTGRGCFYSLGGDLVKVKGIDEYCGSLREIGRDSILVTTETGIKLIKNEQLDSGFQPGIPTLLVLCLQVYQGNLILGTNDRGIYLLDRKGNLLENITTKQGLNSNSVMSMQMVNDELWVGTGRGVNKIMLNMREDHLSAMVTSFSGIFSECNDNAMLKIGDRVGIGTTHGLDLYPLNLAAASPVPKVVIENIQTYTTRLNSKGYLFKSGYKLPNAPSLPSGESHISIRFQSVQYNATKTYYEYKLDGLDESFSKPMQNDEVDYPNLPPSEYTFLVKTVTAGGAESAAVSYRFIITPMFYQTTIFRILAVLVFLIAVLVVYLYKTFLDRRKNIFMNQLRLSEQENVRRQTAEDFHDDIGNKLTRVNMLSELLDRKIPHELADQKKIVRQIRESVSEMYGGTRNILWALNPKNDHLGEIISEVTILGNSLFEHTTTSFTTLPYPDDLNKIRVPLGYSHNLILIFKELINNISKHARAANVTFSPAALSNNRICFQLADDGIGYQTDTIFTGNGLRNVHNRSKKLHGEITIESHPEKGTVTTLTITFP